MCVCLIAYSLDTVYKPKILAIVKRMLINKFAIDYIRTNLLLFIFFKILSGVNSYLFFNLTNYRSISKVNSSGLQPISLF